MIVNPIRSPLRPPLRIPLERAGKLGFFGNGTRFNFATATVSSLVAQGMTNTVSTANPPGMVVAADGTLQYGAHNLLLNSATLGTQSVTVVSGLQYTVAGYGTGSVTLSGGATGTLSPGGASTQGSLTFTASTTSVTFTVSGSITSAQLNRGARVLDYVATTAAPIYAPRLSYWGGVQRIRTEPGRTNDVLWSRDYTNAAWGKGGGLTVTANNTASLNGTVDACLLTGVAATNTYLNQQITVTASTNRSVSWFVKGGTSTLSRCAVMISTLASDIASAQITWSGGVPSIGTLAGTWLVNPVAESWGSGWYRIKGSYATGANVAVQVVYHPCYNNDATTGYLDHIQDELGIRASFPIITGAAAVTRDTDLTRPPASFVTDGPQTVRVKFVPEQAANGGAQYLIGRTSLGAPVFLNGTGNAGVYDGVTQTATAVATADGATQTVASRWGSSAQGISLNGGTLATGVFDNTMGSGTTSALGSDGTAAGPFMGDILSVESVASLASDSQMLQLSAGTLS